MCQNDISGNPRPLRLLKLLSQNEYSVDIMSWNNKYDISKHYNNHFILQRFSDRIFKKNFRRLLKIIQIISFNKKIYSIISAKILRVEKNSHLYNKYDLVIIEDIEFLPLLALNKQNYKIIFDMREYYPLQEENNIYFKIIEKQRRHWILKKFLKSCDILYTVSNGLARKYFTEYGVNVGILRSLPNRHDFSPELCDNEKIKMVHHGIANSNRKIEKMIYMMALLDDRFSLDLYLTGDEKNINHIKNISINYDRVKIFKPIAFIDIIKTINNYDIGLFYNEPTTFNLKHCLPNKLFEFIQARLAVAISPSPDMAEIVNQYQCGIVADEYSIESMANKLNKLSIDEIMTYKYNSHKAADELCFENESINLLDNIHQLFGRSIAT
jgi:glycosyltransferase involved in cell wall biosynthesis